MFYWLEHFAQLIDDLGSGSTVKGISVPDLKSLRLELAALDEQVAIASVLSDMDTEIGLLEERLAKTRALKLGVMQELLTGRTRLV